MSVNVNAYKLTPSQTLLTLRGNEVAEQIPQALHIIAVIDVSGSMEEEGRLENVKRSLQFMFPMLNARDLVSIVTFNSDSQIVCQAVHMNPDGIATMERHLIRIAAAGGTNLGAGILSAMDICASNPNSHKPCVLLLTDGEVNTGMRESPQLLRLLGTFHRAYPTLSLYSVGYGLQHNTALMSSMATEVSGAYSIVQNLEQVATVFGDMLGGLASIAAQNLEVMIHSHGKMESKFRTTSSATHMHIHIGDLYAGAEQSLIVEDHGDIVVRYFNSAVGEIQLADITHHRETDGSIVTQATGLRLRLATSNLMTKISEGTVTLADVTELLTRLEAEQANHAWIGPMILELQGTANQLRHGGLSRQVTAAAANQSAWLAMGRGVTMMSQAPEDYADVFSTPAQRMVSGGLSRAVSGPAPTTGAGFHGVPPPGGSAMHIPTVIPRLNIPESPNQIVIPDLNSFPPFPGTIPPPPPAPPRLVRQHAVSDGIPSLLAPIPLTRETGEQLQDPFLSRVLNFSGIMEDEVTDPGSQASSIYDEQPDSP
jgi:hypothetical protein